ncbi:type II secretion system minor pseudopilin GspK [Aquabacterium sp. A7-Y]|uniref:type II secretion system minor pseudopilin GspK n=1 Tax=Aquabacterium sp. A7-Y TaxID=1349605 RepID=UPI00223D2B85|nr:type II secretion system minor pseudopilin GspK [Aquabacterium sp. A7-Y]MCW7539885.1 type II secretion system minor pseudopilin GspK [Aquabacterium sp. A7-Y]
MPALRPAQRGAALLTAMIIVTLVATLASAMYWRQWRSVQIEVAERARSQSAWILTGALSWSRLILAEDARTGGPDHLSEPWAIPLAEARLSTFLAADNANAEDGPEAFLAGQITDAQARFNLRNLVQADGQLSEPNVKVLQRLCEQLNIDSSVPQALANALRLALPASAAPETPGAPGPADGTAGQDAPLLPPTVEQLHWLGIDVQSSKRLAPYVTLLPKITKVNLNTAPREVLAAVLGDPASADRVMQVRQRTPFKNVEDAINQLGQGSPAAGGNLGDRVSISSEFFEVRGRMRIEQKVVEERSVVERRGNNVAVVQRERASFTSGNPLTP